MVKFKKNTPTYQKYKVMPKVRPMNSLVKKKAKPTPAKTQRTLSSERKHHRREQIKLPVTLREVKTLQSQQAVQSRNLALQQQPIANR